MRLEYCLAKIVQSLVLFFLVATVPCTATERIEATYNFVWNGFHISTAETIAEFTPKQYFLGIEIKTHGLLQMATKARGDIKVSGQLLPGGHVQAREFSATGTWKGDPFLQKISFEENGVVATSEAQRSNDWLEKNKRAPVPDALKKGPDPTSLFVSLLQQQIDVNTTSQLINLRTYDGETVIDWQLGCSEKTVQLKQSRHSPHHGDAFECSVNSTLVAGALLEEKKITRIKRGPRGRRGQMKVEDSPAKVWLMAINNSKKLMPVRAEVPSSRGTVDLYLSKLSVNNGR